MFAFARTAFCAALILTATHVAAAEPHQPEAHPAMWKLESGGTTIYFFGSMHMLPPGLKWKTPIVERAMEQSDVFFFEMPMSDGSFRLAAGAMSKNIFRPKGKTLSAMLSPAGKKQLAAVAKDLGIPMKTLDRMRPWSAAIVLSTAAGRSTQVVAGVDKQVGYYALMANKTRRYFETGPQQAEMFARMGDADGAKGFEIALADVKHTSQDFRQLSTAWVTGDVPKLEKLAETGLENLPAGRKVLLDERNQAWVTKIPDLLQEHRTFFITVGAAHLAGHGSVIALLCGKGLKVQRIDTRSGNAKAACPAQAQVVAARTPD